LSTRRLMKKILVVDDEKKMRDFISFFLHKAGYTCLEASNGHQAIQILKDQAIDLVLLDLMMPLMNGFETCQALRNFSDIPVIMLTAVEGEEDHIRGYNMGVDDYITKPFKVNILLAKIKRLFDKEDKENCDYLNLYLDRASHQVLVDGKECDLAPKEYGVLVYMLDNKNVALSRDQILDRVWGLDFEGGTRVVDNHIKKLRSKLGAFACHIKTVTGHGYKIEV